MYVIIENRITILIATITSQCDYTRKVYPFLFPLKCHLLIHHNSLMLTQLQAMGLVCSPYTIHTVYHSNFHDPLYPFS